MSKDNVVIEIGCMRYVVGVSDISCSLKNSGGSCIACKTQVPEVYAVCNEMGAVSCISATKIQPEPNMYFAWNREEARHLVGKVVDFSHLRVGSKWLPGKLIGLLHQTAPFVVEDIGTGEQVYVNTIREIPTTKLTLAKLIEMAGIEGEVEIVEEGE